MSLAERLARQRELVDQAKEDEETPRDVRSVPLDDDTSRQFSGSGTGDTPTASYGDYITNRIESLCWRGPDDMPDPEKMVVDIRLSVDARGQIVRRRVLNQNEIRFSGDQFWVVAMERAQRAIIDCEPYRPPPQSVLNDDGTFTFTLNFAKTLSD